MNHVAYFEIQADDLGRAKTFYADVFGWAFTRQEGLPIEYWHIETGDMTGGLLERPVSIQPMTGTNAFTCSVIVEDYDAMEARILAKGGRDAMAKFAVPGRCWQGYFLDTEGNVFGIFQPDENAA